MERTIKAISLIENKLCNIDILKKKGAPPYEKCIAARLDCGDLYSVLCLQNILVKYMCKGERNHYNVDIDIILSRM